tara:strand:- start:215 stop:439 length:225 start_codon:yes stop_codon:yes gene_type:complete
MMIFTTIATFYGLNGKVLVENEDLMGRVFPFQDEVVNHDYGMQLGDSLIMSAVLPRVCVPLETDTFIKKASIPA